MKKIFKMFLISFLILVPVVKAETLTESTEKYVAEINELTLETKGKLNLLTNWFKTYNSELTEVIDESLGKSLVEKIENESYTEFINELANALNSSGYEAASMSLKNIKLETSIDNYLTLEEELITFLDTNSANMNIINGTEEGVDCTFKLYDAIMASYDTIKPAIKSSFNELSAIFADILDEAIMQLEELSNSELTEIFEKYEEYSIVLSNLITNFSTTLDEYEVVLSELVGNESVLLDRFKNKLRNDIKSILNSCETKLSEPIDSFIEDRWLKLELDVDNVVNSDDTISNKNNRLYNRIDTINNVNDKFTIALNEIMDKADSSLVSEKIKKILNKVNKEFDAAIKYIEDHLVVGDYDIKLIENHDKNITLNRAQELIILDKLFTIESFKTQVLLANEGFGVLNFKISTKNNVGTKSVVQVLNNDVEMKKYTVVVKGDVDSNGRITVTDVLETASAALQAKTFDDIEFIAADLDDSERITVTDVLEIANRALVQGGSI